MAEMKERRKSPRRATPKPDSKAVMESSARGTQAPEEVRRRIEEAAYYRAKQRGFEPGHELEDWIEAESEVMQRHGSP